MSWFVVYRHGENVYNQAEKKSAIAVVEANSKEEACKKVSEIHTIYSNQHLVAVSESLSPLSDWVAACEYQEKINKSHEEMMKFTD
jgi:hypothetical protein